MNGKNRSEGITLIALVVTIIVLLILAGISIMLITDNGGIINRAMNAKEKTKVGSAKEKVKMAVLSSMTEEDDLDLTILKQKLSDQNITCVPENPTSLPFMVKTDDETLFIEKDGSVTSQNENKPKKIYGVNFTTGHDDVIDVTDNGIYVSIKGIGRWIQSTSSDIRNGLEDFVNWYAAEGYNDDLSQYAGSITVESESDSSYGAYIGSNKIMTARVYAINISKK